ncbi:hypothetical protein GE061_006167 [Apolygus lucorum]|uniref:Cilia- and flagella-associated protein 126 n=1 Tax=Apolygus lucorum TaxID=248454 RepID=A0A8S9WUI4_APOLU|nr:hypothetical protein GE061_006167 [Apolygus lucorum]
MGLRSDLWSASEGTEGGPQERHKCTIVAVTARFETNFQPERLGNWQVPKKYPHERPRARRGHTKVIADDRGHLLPGVTRIEPWNHFTSTWQLPKRITRKVARDVNTLRPTGKHLTSWEKRSYHVPIYDRNNPPALPSTVITTFWCLRPFP